MTHWGIDVSNHQGNFDFAKARAEGFTWATHKVTEADNYADPYWPRARAEMERHFPGRFGGYVFCRTNVDPNREADFLASKMPNSIPLQIDYEDTKNGGSVDDLLRRVRAYQERGYRLLPIYLPRWFWSDRMKSGSLRDLPVPVWNSHYVGGTGFASTLYGNHQELNTAWADMGGKPVSILQFTEKALVAGQLIDANIFRGNDRELAALFGETNTGGIVADTPNQVLEQLLGQPGPQGPGWPQLGNRSMVDALSVILTQLVGRNPAGFDGWEQLGDRTLVDGVAQVLENQTIIDGKLNAVLDWIDDNKKRGNA